MTGIALDTNILVYAEDLDRRPDNRSKTIISRKLIASLMQAQQPPVLSIHVLAELWHVLQRRSSWPRDKIRTAVDRIGAVATIAPSGAATLEQALHLATTHKLQIFDALIIAAAAEARCDLLVSEDLQDGFSWRGLTVTNPFGTNPAPALTRILAGRGGA